jgi:DNA repair protein RadC
MMDDTISNKLVESGWEALSTRELLALALGPGLAVEQSLNLASRILSEARHHSEVEGISRACLQRAGLSERRSTALLAAFQLARQLRRPLVLPSGRRFHSSSEVFEYFRRRFNSLRKECFWSLLLDGKNRILSIERISEGSLTSSLVHPREVFRPAIEFSAAGVLFVHNHPSGDPSPSEEDLRVTNRLVETGRVMGIRVLDHVIIGSYRFFSFADEGML